LRVKFRYFVRLTVIVSEKRETEFERTKKLYQKDIPH